jgi:predicted nucleic acid-binding protein
MAVLVDSGVWIAFYNTRDQHHDNAVRIMNEINSGAYGNLLSTDYILDESVNYCLVRYSSDKSVLVGEAIINTTDLIKITQDIIDASWEFFKKDKERKTEKFLSFTDCTTLIAAKTLGVKYVATFDSQFKEHISVLSL